MKRVVAASAAVMALSCADMFMAHEEVVARVGSAELTVDRLAEIVAAAPDIPVNRDVMELLAYRWTELAAWAQRTAAGDSLMDSSLVMETMWPQARGAVVDSFYVVAIAPRQSVTEAQVDSAYRVGEMRIVSHVLKRVTDSMTSEERTAQRTAAEAIRNQLAAGGSWDAANAQSDDSTARAIGGLLPVLSRGLTVERFENTAYALGPGEVSAVTQTPVGYHVILRPTLDDVREPFTDAVQLALTQRADSIYEVELIEARNVELSRTALGDVREALQKPFRARTANEAVATYDGGRFTLRDLVRWFQVIPTSLLQRLPAATDEELGQFVRSLVVRELIAAQADSAGIGLTAAQRDSLTAAYRRRLADLRQATMVIPDSLRALGATPEEQGQFAMELLDRYLELGVQDTRLLIPVPPFLADLLLEDVQWRVNPAGVDRAVERAVALRSVMPTAAPAPTGGNP